MAGGEHDRARGSHSSEPPNSVTTPWVTIEDYLRKCDESKIKKYDDDLNTLLVFAGLYSAILTAFLIQFYTLLQAPSDQPTIDILNRISGQLGDLSPGNHEPAGNVSASSSTAFRASASSTWINALWFLSLLLSLAAALFGMIAKQWLGEFLTWTSLSADPSEVVVLRQLRSDAWVKWQVPAIIGAIPALLEIALVLFLCGMVILLWTLNDMVAIVLTVFTSVFFAAALAVTILPTIHHECPYKSPVGWACVYIWNKIMTIMPKWTTSHNRQWELYRRAHVSAKTWVRRDLYRVTGVPRLSPEAGLSSNRTTRNDNTVEDSNRTAENDRVMEADRRAEYAAEVLIPMAQALGWVRKDSEKTHVLASVRQCIDAMHETADALVGYTGDNNDRGLQVQHRFKSAFFATCKLFKTDVRDMRLALREAYSLAEFHGVGRSGYHTWIKCVLRGNDDSLQRLIRPVIDSVQNAVPNSQLCDDEEIQIVCRLLLSAIEKALDYMFPNQSNSAASSTQVNTGPSEPTVSQYIPEPQADPSSPPLLDHITVSTSFTAGIPSLDEPTMAAFVEALCLTEVIALYRPEHKDQKAAEDYLKLITKLYTILYDNPNYELNYPGLRTMVYQSLCRLGNPETVLGGWIGEQIMRSGLDLGDQFSEHAGRYARLAIQIFHNNKDYRRPEDRHMFVVLSNLAFEASNEETDFQILKDLIDLASEAAARCIKGRWYNCGYYSNLPWITTLCSRPSEVLRRMPWPALKKLLDNVEKCAIEGIVIGDKLLEKLETLRDLGSDQSRIPSPMPGLPEFWNSPDPDSEQVQSSIAAILQTSFDPIPNFDPTPEGAIYPSHPPSLPITGSPVVQEYMSEGNRRRSRGLSVTGAVKRLVSNIYISGRARTGDASEDHERDAGMSPVVEHPEMIGPSGSALTLSTPPLAVQSRAPLYRGNPSVGSTSSLEQREDGGRTSSHRPVLTRMLSRSLAPGTRMSSQEVITNTSPRNSITAEGRVTAHPPTESVLLTVPPSGNTTTNRVHFSNTFSQSVSSITFPEPVLGGEMGQGRGEGLTLDSESV